MIMELPRKFQMYPYACVKNGMLYIIKLERVEDLMYELSYALKKKKCVYCGKNLRRTNSTMDHRYPRDVGGISITNNLFPTCPKCNSHKSNLTHEKYLEIQNLSKEERKRQNEKFIKEREKAFKETGFILPKDWINYMEISDIKYQESEQNLRGKKYHRIVEFWNKNHKVPRPVIVDKNNRLIDGYNIIIFAQDFGITIIPVIKLENVEVI